MNRRFICCINKIKSRNLILTPIAAIQNVLSVQKKPIYLVQLRCKRLGFCLNDIFSFSTTPFQLFHSVYVLRLMHSVLLSAQTNQCEKYKVKILLWKL